MKLLPAYFPNENALGKHITPGASNHGKPQPREIVGIVGNVKSRSLEAEDRTGILHPRYAAEFWFHGGLSADQR